MIQTRRHYSFFNAIAEWYRRPNCPIMDGIGHVVKKASHICTAAA
jgi:hypothetical protein